MITIQINYGVAVRFKGLYLNLLAVLDVLLEHRNVTRAAEQLNVSQPAISAALRRLRDHFNDELLVPYGKRMVPTAYADRLQHPLRALLSDANALVTMPAHFDPAASQRRFGIMASDFVLWVVLGDLLPRFEKIAPGIRLEANPPSDSAQTLLEAGELDLFVSPPQYLSANHPQLPFFDEDHVVAGWSENPLIAKPLDRSVLESESFLSAQVGHARQSFAETELAKQGIALRSMLSITHFSLIPELLIGTRYLSVMHERMARKAMLRFPIAYQPMPVAIPPMREVLQFHRSKTRDIGLQWLIGELRQWAR
jgi:DNA-binding transcriptional LysR family regulator